MLIFSKLGGLLDRSLSMYFSPKNQQPRLPTQAVEELHVTLVGTVFLALELHSSTKLLLRIAQVHATRQKDAS